VKSIISLLIALLIMTALASNTPNITGSMTVSREFRPDERIGAYIALFQQGSIDHSGLRNLIQPEEVKAISTNITLNVISDLEKARRIHEFIKNEITYEPRLEPVSAEQVLIDKWGDCSEMAVLAASMLESLNIKAYITNGQGHAFVIALINDYWVIVDPTQDFETQTRWINNLPETQAFLVNSSTTLLNS
jgi:transglutaminase-like putative cysteine protease